MRQHFLAEAIQRKSIGRMKATKTILLVALLVGVAAASSQQVDSRLRRRAEEEAEEALPTGFFANVWNVLFNGQAWNWKPFGFGGSDAITDLGAFVFAATLDGISSSGCCCLD